MITSHFYRLIDREIMAYQAAVASVEKDGVYTDEEVRIVLGFDEDSWELMSPADKSFWRKTLEEDAGEDGYSYWDEEEPSYMASSTPEEENSDDDVLTFGAFFGSFFGNLGIFGWFFLVAGGVEAYKIPAAAG